MYQNGETDGINKHCRSGYKTCLYVNKKIL